MKWLLVGIAWLSSLLPSNTLVHFKKMEKGSNGCKINDKEVAVGEYVQDENSCGAYTCQNKEGETFIHYCQIPATFAECPETAVITTLDFPECCWTCATWENCGGAAAGSGAPPAEGGAPPAEGGAPPAEGGDPPAEGRAPPAEGRAPPAEGRAPPAEGGETTRPKPVEKPLKTRTQTILSSKHKKAEEPSESKNNIKDIKIGGSTPIIKPGGSPPIIKTDGGPPMIKIGRTPPIIKTGGSPPVIKTGESAPIINIGESTPIIKSGEEHIVNNPQVT